MNLSSGGVAHASPAARSNRERALAEADRLLNDPDARCDPARVWELLAQAAAAPEVNDAQGRSTAAALASGKA